MTRIVIMASSLDVLGGAQRVAYVAAEHLARRGHAVDLVGVAPADSPHETPTPAGVRRFTLMPEVWPALPVELHRSGKRLPPDPAVLAERDRLSSAATAALTAVLDDGPPGVVVVTQVWAMEHLALVPHEAWAVIGQYHSSIEAAATGGDLDRLLRGYADIDAVALLTPDDAAWMRRMGLPHATWLPNPLAFWPADPVEVRDTDAGVVGYLGRLSHEKGVAFLVDAWGQVAERFPRWRLRIVGSGADEVDLRARAATAGGADRIEFHPPVDDPEAALRSFDILVQPSLTEGLPLAVAEAASLGLPIVATDCSSGMRLLTDDGRAARLVARGDAEALAAGLASVMASVDERRRLGAAARRAVEPFHAEVAIDAWESLIGDVLR